MQVLLNENLEVLMSFVATEVGGAELHSIQCKPLSESFAGNRSRYRATERFRLEVRIDSTLLDRFSF